MKSLWENYFSKKTVDPIKVALKSVPIFFNLNTSQIKEITRFVHKRSYKKGEAIFKKNAPGEGMYIIISGQVIIKDPDSKTVFATLNNNNFFGEMALLDEEPRSALAEASEPSILIGFFRPDLMTLVSRFPEIGNKILINLSKVLAERLRESNKILMQKSD
tara:strand:- start:1847 stop:2329 length:483 start_codon:yes stop_codon:yes gene_type:complete